MERTRQGERFGVTVECYAGYRGEQTPRRIVVGERSIEVEEVIDAWLGPDHRYFKVTTGDGTWILRHDLIEGRWEVSVFEAG